MKAATSSTRQLEQTKILAIVAKHPQIRHTRAKDLASFFEAGDVLVVNRSGTLPSSFTGRLERTGTSIEIRLAAFQGKNSQDLSRWYAIAFGAGDWRMATEDRGLPPSLESNDIIAISDDLRIIVESVDTKFNRLLKITFASSDLVRNLYLAGKPIQYSYLKEQIAVYDQQTLFAGPPLSVEPPSAAFALSWAQVLDLEKRGVKVATILHSAGISSSGSSDLDAKLPLAEWFEVPERTVELIANAKGQGRKIIALGTTVARALESSVKDGNLAASSGFTTLKLGPHSRLSVVDGLISGLHAPGTSHLELSKAFCASELIERAYREAESQDYRDHEFGDLSFLSCS